MENCPVHENDIVFVDKNDNSLILICKSADTGDVYGYRFVESFWQFLDHNSPYFRQAMQRAALDKLELKDGI